MTFARLCSRLVKCASSVMLELVFTISRKYFNVYWRNVTAKQKYELTPAFLERFYSALFDTRFVKAHLNPGNRLSNRPFDTLF